MCGIAGIYAYHYAANPVDRTELLRIRDHMSARGPDGVGEWSSQDERVMLGHRRVSIIYLFRPGFQPTGGPPCQRALPAGATLWVDSVGTRAVKQYYSLAATYRNAELANAPAANNGATLREALLDSVRHHLVADVPVGAFLSSGIDSGALVGLMRDAGQREIQTVTVAFEEFRGRMEDEAPIAAEIASRYGTRHTTRVVTEQEFR